MTFYKKEIPMPAISKKTITFSFGDGAKKKTAKNNVLQPKTCINFYSRAGVLRGGFGTRRVFSGNPLQGCEATAAYLYGDEESGKKVLFLTEEGAYSLALGDENNALTKVSSLTFSDVPQSDRYIDKNGVKWVLLFSADGAFAFNGSVLIPMNQELPAVAGCYYYERIFLASATRRDRLYFTTPQDKSNWGAEYRTKGYLDLPSEHGGGIIALVSFGKALYAMREYGVTKISAETENFNFTATPVPMTCGKIYKDSVRRVGDRIVFLASDGVFAFDGNKTERMAESPSEIAWDDPSPRSAVCGVYYVLNFKTKNDERITLFLNVATGETFFSDVNFTCAAFDGNDCYFYEDGELCGFTERSLRKGTPARKVWKSDYTNFGLEGKRKLLRSVTVYGEGKLKLIIRGGHVRENRVYELDLNGRKTVAPLIRDELFLIEAESSDENCALRQAAVVIENPEGGAK